MPDSTLVFDKAGNLYGTTEFGGDITPCEPLGCGTVFELKHHANDSWSESVLYALNKTDGWETVGPVVFDSTGNLYAASTAGGTQQAGIVFELTPSASGKWSAKVLHNFTGTPDGSAPYAGVILDSSGHLIGATTAGGSAGQGTVFEIIP